MSLKEILCAAAIAAGAAGCGSKIPARVHRMHSQHQRDEQLRVVTMLLSGKSYEGNRRELKTLLSGDNIERTSVDDCFAEAGMPFYTSVVPTKDGSYRLKMFVHDCIAHDLDNDGVPDFAAATQLPYNLGVDSEGFRIGNSRNTVLHKRYTDGQPTSAERELYASMVGMLHEKLETGKLSHESILRFRVARERYLNSVGID